SNAKPEEDRPTEYVPNEHRVDRSRATARIVVGHHALRVVSNTRRRCRFTLRVKRVAIAALDQARKSDKRQKAPPIGHAQVFLSGSSGEMADMRSGERRPSDQPKHRETSTNL
ncbi:MAG: hypothetical protein IH988_11670, partial [Planctomycetes bacterium]|nr:hypothetical protein [Planctomycetota bacterium]